MLLEAKQQALAALKSAIKQDLANAQASHKAMQEGATHEESKPENDKDTRALEASYVARGQAKRVMEFEEELAKLNALKLRPFDARAPAALGAVVELSDDDDEVLVYFLAPAGGGRRLMVAERALTVVTPEAPVGRALVGRRQDDDVEIRTPQAIRRCSVLSVS